MGNVFIDSTAVRRVGDGRYGATVDPGWNLRPLPQGGVVTATAARAMVDLLDDPSQRLRTLHTTFVAQVAHGEVDVDVELLRRARTVSHLRADVRNVGQPRGHVTTAVFGAIRRGFEFTDLEPPDPRPAPPDECPSYRDALPPEVLEQMGDDFEPVPFWERVEGRPVIGHAPWDDYEPGRAERGAWCRMDDPPHLDDGTIDPLSFIVLLDMMPNAVDERLTASDDRNWFAPSIDLTVHILDQTRSPWLLAHNRVRHAGDGYASADMALWDYGDDGRDEPRLVAYATQLFLFSFFG